MNFSEQEIPVYINDTEYNAYVSFTYRPESKPFYSWTNGNSCPGEGEKVEVESVVIEAEKGLVIDLCDKEYSWLITQPAEEEIEKECLDIAREYNKQFEFRKAS